MSYEQIALENFAPAFYGTTELSSVALGGQVISVSDEFFAEAFHLLLVEAAPSLKGQFGPKGALFSGWESRRHNQSYDWCVIKLGTSGSVLGFDIDTAHFHGNEAPQASVDALLSSDDPSAEDARWTEILPVVNLGPNSRHLFKIPESARINYVKLNMYPDGGIARFRVYGLVTPVYPALRTESFDLAHVFAGGRVETTSDQHFGVGSNLIMPGRGVDMRDGWETKRSRQKGRSDWAIIKLGIPGFLEYVEIDTAHFMGNFPESCELHALAYPIGGYAPAAGVEWTRIMSRTPLGPHRQHFFQLDNVAGRAYTHVKLTIYPDGGVKRVRIIGRRAESGTILSNMDHARRLPVSAALNGTTVIDESQHLNGNAHPNGSSDGGDDVAYTVVATNSRALPSTVNEESHRGVTLIPALPLTPEAFAPFGNVVQAYADVHAAPRGTKITAANQGTALKFHKLAPILSSYPPGSKANANLSVYRCKPLEGVAGGGECVLRVLERHPYTNQAFVPMGGAGSYLVVVAKNGLDDQPDVGTLRAFVASAAQTVVYDTAVWHQPMAVIGNPMDFTCVETQIGNGDAADCEIVELDGQKGIFKVKLYSEHLRL